MPKMPENEAKEETAESREEKKEQVGARFLQQYCWPFNSLTHNSQRAF